MFFGRGADLFRAPIPDSAAAAHPLLKPPHESTRNRPPFPPVQISLRAHAGARGPDLKEFFCPQYQ